MWHNTWKTLHMRQRGAATYSHVVQIASSHNSLAKIHYALCCGWTHCHLQRFSKQVCVFEKTHCSWFCLFKLLSCDLWKVFNWSDVILIRLALCFHSYNVSWYLFARKQNEHNFWFPTDGCFSPDWLTVCSFLAAKAKPFFIFLRKKHKSQTKWWPTSTKQQNCASFGRTARVAWPWLSWESHHLGSDHGQR